MLRPKVISTTHYTPWCMLQSLSARHGICWCAAIRMLLVAAYGPHESWERARTSLSFAPSSVLGKRSAGARRAARYGRKSIYCSLRVLHHHHLRPGLMLSLIYIIAYTYSMLPAYSCARRARDFMLFSISLVCFYSRIGIVPQSWMCWNMECIWHERCCCCCTRIL